MPIHIPSYFFVASGAAGAGAAGVAAGAAGAGASAGFTSSLAAGFGASLALQPIPIESQIDHQHHCEKKKNPLFHVPSPPF